MNIHIHQAENKIKEILEIDIEGKNEIGFLEYKMLQLQTGDHFEGASQVLKNIEKKMKKPYQSQENFEVFMKYIEEYLKKK